MGSGSLPSTNSAIGLAAALAPVKQVNVNDLLSAVELQDMTYDLHIEQSVIEIMTAETSLAKAQSRRPFMFVDLTGRDILPMWLSPQSVGG